MRPPSAEWRENFDSAGALGNWAIEDPDGASVEVDEDSGALLLHLPTDDYNVVRVHAREVADIAGDWVASTYMGLKEGDIEQCSEFTVHTGDATYPSWQFEIDHWDESFLIYVRYSADNRFHSIWEGYFEDYTDEIPGGRRLLRSRVEHVERYPHRDVPTTRCGSRGFTRRTMGTGIMY